MKISTPEIPHTLGFRAVSMTIQDQQNVGLTAPQQLRQTGYMTLKEASERFGYSPDYIGQLIRKGKIEGKQVYSNLAWVTTEDAIAQYLEREKKQVKQNETPLIDRLIDNIGSESSIALMTWGLRGVLLIALIAAIFVFYFISITIDHRSMQEAERALLARENIVFSSQSVALSKDHITYEK